MNKHNVTMAIQQWSDAINMGNEAGCLIAMRSILQELGTPGWIPDDKVRDRLLWSITLGMLTMQSPMG